MDRIVDLDCATMTVHRTTLWIKKSGTKRYIHALPHSHQKKCWVDGNVDKLAVTVYGREQIICGISGASGKIASTASHKIDALLLIGTERHQKVAKVVNTVTSIHSIVQENHCLGIWLR